MRLIRKFAISVVAATCLLTSNTMAMNSLLDGMFVNVTAPDVVSTQMRGTLSGGGVYLRTPVDNIQVMSLDLPRFSAGCGGIDAYLGSFSFITAEKLTQFIRKLTQQVPPLLFKMAIGQMSAALSAEIDKFQHMAQMMNDMQANSCQLAQGLIDSFKNPAESAKSLSKSIDSAIGSSNGWSGDFFSAKEAAAEEPTGTKNKVCTPDSTGTKKSEHCGNITWEAIRLLKNKNIAFGITDEEEKAREILLSLIGTDVIKPGATNKEEVKPLYLPPQITLDQLFNPPLNKSGKTGFNIIDCTNDDCTIYVTDSFFETPGIEGYVRKQLFGSERATAPAVGSIVHKMGSCTGDCAIDVKQKGFLNAISKVPAVTLLTRAQFSPDSMNRVAEYLIPMMVNEISILYGQSVIDVANKVYTNNDFPAPAGHMPLIQKMHDDLKKLKDKSRDDIEQSNKLIQWLEQAFASNSKHISNIFGK